MCIRFVFFVFVFLVFEHSNCVFADFCRIGFRGGENPSDYKRLIVKVHKASDEWKTKFFSLGGISYESLTFSEQSHINRPLAVELGLDRFLRLYFQASTSLVTARNELMKFSEVFDAVDYDPEGGIADYFPTDPRFIEQTNLWSHDISDGHKISYIAAGIDALTAWNFKRHEDSVLIAIADSGLANHVEISDRLLNGWNTFSNSPDTTDYCNHGTHVAGIAAARRDNDEGIAGIASRAQILPVKVLCGCSGGVSHLATGIIYATDRGAKIISMSLQYSASNSFLNTALTYARSNGVLLVAAAGNQGRDTVSIPAQIPGVVAVGATDSRDRRASFSNYGSRLDLVAPGVDILSLDGHTGGYMQMSGTSMAAPHVSGVAAALWGMNPRLSVEHLEKLIFESVDDLGAPGRDREFGRGRLNFARAVSRVNN